MHSQEQFSSSLFRTICLAIIAALVIAVAIVPAGAQNSVPATAVQAAKMPEFAPRLAHPAKPQAARKAAAFAAARNHRGPLQADDIYDNGPTNGTTDAWTINFGFIISDSFPIPAGGATITGATFAMWLIEGDTLESARLSITSGENGGTSYFNQTVTFTQSGCSLNQYSYDVCTETTSFNGPALIVGTYWANLQNAVTADREPVYWDENSGPSSASENEVGTIPSESFTILGSASTTTTSTSSYNNYSCPAPQNGFHDLHDFGYIWQSNQDPASGVAIDRTGNFYGTIADLGSQGVGLLYELAQSAGHWFLSPLYSFLGGSDGSSPDGVIVGPEGGLYGAASGGTQTCGRNGESYCGLIYEARPGPAACATALCGWDETTIYQFTSNTDAWGGSVTAFDSAGNLYGISGSGGANGAGAVFELTPAQGSWTEQVLYSFTGGSDGGGPSSLLVGHDGNLYGITVGGGLYGWGVVFQLVPSAGGWTENVLYAFTGNTDNYYPAGLLQDSQGNLYGFTNCVGYGGGCNGFDVVGYVFELSPSGGGWVFTVIYNNAGECDSSVNAIHSLAIDAAGNLYAGQGGLDLQVNYYYYCGEVVAVPSHTVLVRANADIFTNLISDANGNLYGTTATCGGLGSLYRGSGMVWQYSP